MTNMSEKANGSVPLYGKDGRFMRNVEIGALPPGVMEVWDKNGKLIRCMDVGVQHGQCVQAHFEKSK